MPALHAADAGWRSNSQVRVALLHSRPRRRGCPEELEPVLAPGGRISIGELVTEELLLESADRAAARGRDAGVRQLHEAAAGPAAETHRPFAQLADLLKR